MTISLTNQNVPRQPVNQEVAVTGLYFRPGRDIKGYPKRMEYEGREYTFIDSGLRCLIKKGQQLFEIFEMTDGKRDFRLRFDASAHNWTLIGIRERQQFTM